MSQLFKTAALACASFLICTEAYAAKRTPISRSQANMNIFVCGQVPGSFPLETLSSSGCCFEDDQSDKTYCTMCNKETQDCAEYEARETSPRTLGKQVLQQSSPVVAPTPPSPRKKQSNAPAIGSTKKP
ncbi:hypothetical protein [uncultured Pelagimonas sp.]|uniref:hypothetical protein n=1 Tax=uncultured Pelagimonas sp. TaxID=1618102 RepID=UPI00260E2D51|nr:hypothetical protein [uncultured Pelagimonas sp.]